LNTTQINKLVNQIVDLETIMQDETTTEDEKEVAMKKMDSLIGRLFVLGSQSGQERTISEILDKIDGLVTQKLSKK
jgi:hypothetical protein